MLEPTETKWIRRSSFPLWIGLISAILSLSLFLGDLFSDGKLFSSLSTTISQLASTESTKEPNETYKFLPEAYEKSKPDRILTTMLKGVWIGISFIITLILSVIAFLIDLVRLPFGGDVEVIRMLWDYSWNHIIDQWFYTKATTGGIFLGAPVAFFTALMLFAILIDLGE